MSGIDEIKWKAKGPIPVYAQEELPKEVRSTIFLAGPTPRDEKVKGWRGEALHALRRLGFDGHVFIPEESQGKWNGNYVAQLEWEEEALHRADVIAFWVPRDPTGAMFGTPMAAFTTNIEWGRWYESGKVVWGAPDWAKHTRYPEYYAKKLGAPVAATLEETLREAVKMAGDGAPRIGGEATVPLYIWEREEFQNWYQSQLNVGNTLNGLRVLSTFPSKKPFCYTLHVNVHVGSEDRDKTNELVLYRSDVSTVMLYHRGGLRPQDTKVVLVREFRSPVRNAEGFVYELPGGSSKTGGDPRKVAADEVLEETGFQLDPSRLKEHGSRQMLATLSSHHGHFYSYALTDQELEQLESADKTPHGVQGDSERTYVEVRTLKEVLEEPLVDWASIGMILTGVQ